MPQTPTGWGSVLFLSVFCTGIAFAITAVQQKHTSAVHVGLIFTLEPLFSAIVAFFFAEGAAGSPGLCGGGADDAGPVDHGGGLSISQKEKSGGGMNRQKGENHGI
ncbi:MAG: EamA family transporter [Oscillospiraceae bacterium]